MSLSRVSALLLAALFALVSAAQGAFANPLDVIDEDDREALEAVVLYPEDVREQALQVSTEAALLVELQKLQEESQDDFKDLLGPYSQDDQEQLYELSRYPDLVEAIARGGEKGRGELERIASDYPDDVRAAAVKQGSERHRVVSRMHALLADFDGRFNNLIEDLPQVKQQAFRGMLRTPELLSLMTEHTAMTVLLGDAFERDPGDLREALADLNLEVAQRNAKEADDWKNTVEADPDLRRDYDQAARDYQTDTGYSAYQAPSRAVVSVSINPYPFWVGYPYWYPVAYDYYDPYYYWYPRRSWGHCGYSYGPRVVFYGGPVYRPWYPSYHFTSWYFSHGGHHARYPYLSDRFVSYYDGPRVVNNIVINNYHFDGRRRVVRRFGHRADYVMPANYLRGQNRRERVERFREYGKMAPRIEQVERETRGKELAGKRGKRPGRDFDFREDDGPNQVARAEARKLVAKNPKDFPELSKATTDDWERPRGKGRGKETLGTPEIGRERGKGKDKGEPSLGDSDRGKGKDRGDPSLGDSDRGKGKDRGDPSLGDSDRGKGKDRGEPSLGDSDRGKGKDRGDPSLGDRGKGKDRDEPSLGASDRGKGKERGNGAAKPTFEGSDDEKGKGKARSEKATPAFERPAGRAGKGDDAGGAGGASGKSKGKDRGSDDDDGKSKGAARSGSGGSKKAAPSFEAPSDEKGKGKDRDDDGGGRSKSSDRTGGGGKKAASARSFDAPDSGSERGAPKAERMRDPEPKRSKSAEPRYQEPRDEAPKYQAPKNEAPRQEPRVERSGGGRDRGNGGGGDGDGAKKKKQEEEEQSQEQGGGKGKRR
jgi:hypothetical protein